MDSGPSPDLPLSALGPAADATLSAKPVRRRSALLHDYPLLISVLAFTLSLVTSLVSAWTSYKKDIHDQQALLASNIQSLQELAVRQAELAAKGTNASGANNASDVLVYGLITSQFNTILHNASDLAMRLGTYATTAELVTLAQGAAGLGSVTEAARLLKIALVAARNSNDESTALRNLGFLEIRWATSPDMRDRGRSRFQEAMNLDVKYPEVTAIPGVISYLKASAELQWSTAIAVIDCAEARIHFAAGQKLLVDAPSMPDLDQLRRAAKQEARTGLGGVATCLP